ncbi:hypothetical protein IMSAGC019_03491 [Lachnospiraceae bacterium]|nr:hypothetical protein IMSAGC019_03491 [Lachnospiraceae bacterium]
MKKTAGWRLACLLAAAVAALAWGCGRQGVTGEGLPVGKEPGAGEGETAMGRYVEEEADLSEKLQVPWEMARMPEGRLVIVDRFKGLLVSQDGGATWQEEGRPWLEGRSGKSYVMDMKVAPDGTLAVIYEDYEEGGDREAASLFDLSPTCALVTPDGQVVPVEISLREEDGYPASFWISDSGRYFVATLGGNIYEVKEDGSSSLFLTTEGTPQLIQFIGNLMMVDGYDFPSPALYDLEKKEYVENQTLEAFVKENYGERNFNGGSWFDMYFFPGEDGAIYLAGKKGLHRLMADGKEIETLIDGSLSRLGSPQYGLKGMAALAPGEFLALFSSGKLVRFTYDPNVASVPGERLKIYSLEESYDIRVAVSAYQVQNPEVYVEYEFGMEEGSGATREDALKKLNTRIMAGEGPDLLMLDGMPVDSYIEKGLLADLNGLIESLGEDALFGNLFQGFAKDGKVYAVPGQVAFPLVLGKKEYVFGMKGIEAAAGQIEQMRQDNPGKAILGMCSEKAIMKMFAVASAPAWKRDTGEINKEAIEEFLVGMKRIYQAQMDGINEKSLETYLDESRYYAKELGEDWMYDLSVYGVSSLDYVAGRCLLQVGLTTYPYGYFDITSVSRAEGFGDTVFAPLEGQCGKVFVPQAVLGINAASQKRELAEDFLGMFLGKDIQCSLGGFAVNREAFEEGFVPEEEYVAEDGQYGSVGMVNGDGLEFTLNIYLPDSQQMAVIRDWMASSDTPYIEDPVFEETVFEEGAKYILGQQELSQAMDAIEQQIAIYITE